MPIIRYTKVLVLLICIGFVNSADAENVAMGKPVSLIGKFGSDPMLSPTVTDGVFLPKDNLWFDGTVWWDANSHAGNEIVVNLLGAYEINALIVQVDDNDAYFLDYLTPGGDWLRTWDVPNYDFEPSGMQTRPNPDDDTERIMLPSTITATMLRLSGNDGDSDLLYSVSEIQAFSVPEPHSVALLALAMLFVARCRCT